MTNNILAAATATPAPTPSSGGGATPRPTPRPTAPNTSTAQLADGHSGSNLLVVAGLVFLCALSLITVARRQTR